MSAKTFCAILVAAGLLYALAGCGEGPVVYKQGTYSGKVDSNPWDNERFKGDQVAWEKAIKARNRQQNESSRVPPTAAN